MCFIIHEKHKEPKIATKDIVCYKSGSKIAKGNFESFWQDHVYRQGSPKRTVKLVVSHRNEIQRGYHSFVKKPVTKLSIAKFIIPKGAKYYYNPTENEYVSNKIIFKGWIK